MAAKMMYCAIPTRLRHRADEAYALAKKMGFVPVIPFNAGPYEDFEGGLLGRERTIEFMLHIQRFCDTCGFFGISEGTVGELRDALARKQDVRVIYGFDPEWEKHEADFRAAYSEAAEKKKNHVIAFVGPSAVGKTHWADMLLAKFPERLARIKNTTTRLPRDPQDGYSYNTSYHFVSKPEFENLISRGAFLEHDSYLGEYYGSSLDSILDVLARKNGIFAITPKGAEALAGHRDRFNLALFLLVPESEETLRKNFLRRGVIDPEKQARLVQEADRFWLPPEVPHSVVRVSGDADTDEKRILSAVERLFV